MPRTSEFIDDEDDQDFKPGKEQVDDEEFEEQKESKPLKRKREDDADKQRDKDGNQIFPKLSTKRRVTIRAFSSGEGSVDLREFYVDKNTQEMKPGKGICLPLAQWNKLKEYMNDIDEAIEALSSSKKQK
ncbi:putative RNA polymerase II transcriptional coactivator [Choanephora cucurbitarum]|uniref:Putative RNA polymerase II transcriptional coactivator n=1 Tax=Choanephora cucurbitarum TaxID=101091 RepID=A0A1C7NME2_9FUNG|nr:putative RNA polymerase II transcriptional coactivator [Choanephora cucurbitarum]